MKEDYLWDKTGDDAEIKALENSLAAFRYRETAPPALPPLEQKVFTLEKQPARRSFFRFAFPAFAAFAALVVILSVVWFQLSSAKTPTIVETVAEHNIVKRAEKTADNSFVAPRETNDPVKPSEEIKIVTAPQIVKVRQTVAPVARRREKTVAPHKKFIEPTESLTKEEQYAYDQLMLALTITGSKLKIVHDRINGIEQEETVSGR